MKGHIRQRNGKWRYIVYFTDEDGRHRQVERVVDGNKADAERALRKAIDEVESGYRYSSGTVNTMFADYIATVKLSCKRNTVEQYESIYRIYVRPALGEKKISAVTVRDVCKIIDEAAVSGARKELIYTVLNGLFKHCYNMRLLTYNPITFVKRPKRQKTKFDTLTIPEYKSIISFSAAQSKKDYTWYIFHIALMLELECGLRRGELAGITWDNVDLENNTLDVFTTLLYINGHVRADTPKTESSKRTLYFSDTMCSILSAYKAKQMRDKFYFQDKYYKNIYDGREYDFVFVWEHGEVVHPLWYFKKLKKALRACGINKHIRFHDLRHTNATLLLQSGVDIKTLQVRLGHADISTTLNIYAHTDLTQQRKAVELLLDNIGGTR